MKDLSLHVLDIAENSVRAEATCIHITIEQSERADTLSITISDNGRGMSPELLSRVTDPFTTTRTTRRVGLGIPLFKDAAEMTGGSFSIESTEGKGTTTRAVFGLSHIDRPPEGDLTGSVLALIQGSPDVDFVYTVRTDRGSFTCDTRELREILGDVPLNEPEILTWIRGYIRENTENL